MIEPQIGIVKTASTNLVDAGDPVTFTLLLTNSGLGAAYDVQVVDALNTTFFNPASVITGSVPTGFVMVASNSAVPTCESDPLPCDAKFSLPGLVFK